MSKHTKYATVLNRLHSLSVRKKIIVFVMLAFGVGILLFLQPVRAATATMIPNADVSTGWTVPVGSSGTCAAGVHCDHVDEGITSNDADYVSTGTAGAGGEIEEFALTSPTSVSSATQVVVNVRLRSITLGSAADTVGIALRVNGALQAVTTVTMTTTITDYTATYNGSWTQSDVDSMQIYLIRNVLGSGPGGSRDDNVAVYNANATMTYVPAVTYQQSAFRWFNNQDINEPLTYVKTYGGASQDRGYSVAQTSDGGYVSTGDTYSFGGGNTDLFISKHDKSGALEWTKTWGGTGGELGYSVAQTSDGGYAVTGQTGSFSAGLVDVVVVKFTADGTLSWSRTWGGGGNEYGQSLVALADGSVVVTGWTDSSGAGLRDIILLKFASNGTLSWNKTFGTTNEDFAEAIVATSDGGFAVAGYTTGSGAGNADQLLLKLDSAGDLSWSRTWGGVGYDDGFGVTQLSDSGFLVTGTTENYGAGGDDIAMVKYNSSGTLQWSRTWGGSLVDGAKTVISSADGGFFVSGQTNSFGAGGDDVLALKYDSSGTLIWNKTWGGTTGDIGHLARQTSDNGFAISGYTTNYGAGGWDAFIVKYDGNGAIDNCSSPMCQTPTATTSSPTVVAGTPSISVATTGITTATPSVVAPDAAYVATFISGKYSNVGSPLASQDTAATAVSDSDLIRLRMNVHVGLSDATPGLETFKLQYVGKGTGTCAAPSGGTPSSYADVTTSTLIAYANNPLTGDGTPLTVNANDPVHGSDSIARQTYEELNDAAITTTIPAGQDGQWDFALKVNTTAPDATNYCFRLIKSGGGLFNTYTNYPELITPTRTINQSSYRFYQNNDGATPGAPLAAQNTASSVASETPLRLRQRLAVDARLLGTSEGSYKLQYAEKSGTCSTSFSGTTYLVNPVIGTQSQTKLAGIAIDNGGLNGITWQNPSNVTQQDGVKATASNTPQSARTSNLLKTSSHGFTVPSNATISGIVLTGGGLSTAVSTDASIVLKTNAGDSADRAQSVVWNGDRQWGGTTDLWGLSNWTPARVNDSNFGASLQALVAFDDGASIDSVSLTVYYTQPPVSGPIGFYDNSSVASGVAIASSNDPTGRTTTYQSYLESDPFTNNVAAIPSGNDGLWDFALTASSAAVGKTYCFRTVKANGDPINIYSQFPELTINAASGGPSLDQQLRGGAGVVNGVKSPFSF